jgi:DNA-binding NarL/FixJ family response regulator
LTDNKPVLPARRTRLLIVEDHAATARGMKTYLELVGYDVDIARTAAAARTAAETTEFDVLVCDLSLPDGTGWDLLKDLQREKPLAAIAYSAYDEPEYHAQCRAAGFREYVVKGASPDLLIAAIERVFPSESCSETAAPERLWETRRPQKAKAARL